MIKVIVFIALGVASASHAISATTEETPRLNITIRTDNKNEFEVGTPRVLACIVVGCAPSLNVTWYLGDIMLRPNVYKEVNRGNYTVSSLTFVPSLTDNGKELVCRATYGHLSEVFEDRVTISVGQRPKCVDSTYKTIRAVEGESQTLQCLVEADPDPEQFVWSFPGGRTIYTSSKRHYSATYNLQQKVPGHESRYSSALVWVPQRDDYGPVHCRALNRFGDQKQPCTFSVVNGVPSTPDCDFHWESQEINVPCGKTSMTSVQTVTSVQTGLYITPPATKITPAPPTGLDMVHPEDAPPIEIIETYPRNPYVITAFIVAIVITVAGCFIYKVHLACCQRVPEPHEQYRSNNLELGEIFNDRNERYVAANSYVGDPTKTRTSPCEVKSAYHRHEYCV